MDPHASAEPGGAPAPLPGHWLLRPLRQEGLTIFLSESRFGCQAFCFLFARSKVFNGSKGGLCGRGFPLSFLPPESTDNPRPPPCHPATLHKRELAFYQGALLRALSGGRRHPKSTQKQTWKLVTFEEWSPLVKILTQVCKSFCIFFF